MVLILPVGRSTTSKDRLRIRTVFTPRKPVVGSARLFNAQMMAARRGSNRVPRLASRRRHPRVCPSARVISLSTMIRLKRANRSPPISSTTARRNHGCSNESGILNQRSTTRTPSMPALKMPHCSVQPTVVKRGLNFPDCAGTAPGLSGNRALAACACTRSFWITRTGNGSLWPSRQRAHFAVTTAVQRGSQSIVASIHNTFPIRPPRWATAFITLHSILQIRMCCLCRSTGT